MSDAIRFEIPDNDLVELTGAGANGSLYHLGGDENNAGNVLFIEAETKPAFDINDPLRFSSIPFGLRLNAGENEDYYDAIKIWAVSTAGNQLISVTPK